MKYKQRDFSMDLKAVSDDGHFSGYASVFGVVDSYNERVAPGAFAASLADYAAKDRKVPILWQHDTAQPIGIYTSMTEDNHGLRADGQLVMDVPRAREALSLMKAGALTGMSIGYYVEKDSRDADTGIRTLNQVKLMETSLVTFPANDAARIDAVKAALMGGDLPTLSDFEDFLREAGFSKSQATAIAGKGLASLLRGEPGNTEANDIAALLSRASSFKR